MNGRRLFVTLVVIALAAALVFRHQVERALGLRTGHLIATLVRGGKSPSTTGQRKGGTSSTGGSSKGSGVSVSGNKASGQNAGDGSKSAGSSTSGGGSQSAGSGGSSQKGGSSQGGSVPPVTSYPGAPAITTFYADISAGKTADAYALLAPGLAAQVTPNAFAQTYAPVKSAQVQDLSLQGAGNFTRTFDVTVAFTLTSGAIETKNGTITVQDQSAGVGTPDWAISALGVTP